jgi:hypothetical protein
MTGVSLVLNGYSNLEFTVNGMEDNSSAAEQRNTSNEAETERDLGNLVGNTFGIALDFSTAQIDYAGMR